MIGDDLGDYFVKLVTNPSGSIIYNDLIDNWSSSTYIEIHTPSDSN